MKRLLGCMLLLLGAGCAGMPPGALECADFGSGSAFCLLPPAALRPIRLTHLVQISRPDGEQSFISRLRVDDQVMRLAAASLFGPNLFSLRYDGHTLTRHGGDAKLRPIYLLAVMQFVMNSPAQLKPALHGLHEQRDANGERCLLNHGTRVVCVRQEGANLHTARLTISMPSAGIKMTLKPISNPTQEPASP